MPKRLHRRSREVSTAPTRSELRSPLANEYIPLGHHLLVTTAGAIYACDCHGTRPIFGSSKHGIMAAKASKDGSGLLAVADSQTVVLHDCRRNRDGSWGLSNTDGTPRLLEYAGDAKSLFLSTTLTGAVQCYSVHEARPSRSGREHPSPPTVLAVNATAQLLLSASEHPPVVYLQNLQLSSPAHCLSPNASKSAVAVAAFHPERPAVFLLGFRDGVLAIYDATKLARRNGTRMDVNASLDPQGRTAELAVFRDLHRRTNRSSAGDPDWAFDAGHVSATLLSTGAQAVGVTVAAFLPGRSSRAFSAGGDGRCRVVDFADQPVVLQTWSVHGHATALAILPTDSCIASERRGATASRRQGEPEDQSQDGALIAVGTDSGRVVLYDNAGVVRHEFAVADNLGIVSLEWVHGETPLPVGNGIAGVPTRLHVQKGLKKLQDPPQVNHSPSHEVLTNTPRYRRRGPVTDVITTGQIVPESPHSDIERQQDQSGTVVRNRRASRHSDKLIEALSPGQQFRDLFSASRNSHRNVQHTRPQRAPPRPHVTSDTFVRAPQDEMGPHRIEPRASRSTLSSEPRELDPNFTFSYLTDVPEKTPEYGIQGAQCDVLTIAPGYFISSTSTQSFVPSSTSDHNSLQDRQDNTQTPSRQHGSRPEGDSLGHPQSPTRRNHDRPGFTKYMNHTAAVDLRRRKLDPAISRQARHSANTEMRTSLDSRFLTDADWSDSSTSATEKPTTTKPTTALATQTVELPDKYAQGTLLTPQRRSNLEATAFNQNVANGNPVDQQSVPRRSPHDGRPSSKARTTRRSRFMPEHVVDMPQPLDVRSTAPLKAGKHQIDKKGVHRVPAVKGQVADEEDRRINLALVNVEKAREDALQREAPHQAEKHKRHKHCPLPAPTPGQFPTSTATTSDDQKYWTPASDAIRELCPRGSSLKASSKTKTKAPTSKYKDDGAVISPARQDGTASTPASGSKKREEQNHKTRDARGPPLAGGRVDGQEQERESLVRAIRDAVERASGTSSSATAVPASGSTLKTGLTPKSLSVSDVVGAYAALVHCGQGLAGTGDDVGTGGSAAAAGEEAAGGSARGRGAPEEIDCKTMKDLGERGDGAAGGAHTGRTRLDGPGEKTAQSCACCVRLWETVECCRAEVVELRRMLERQELSAAAEPTELDQPLLIHRETDLRCFSEDE